MRRTTLPSGLAFSFALALPISASAQVEEFDMATVRVTDPYYQGLFTVDVEYLVRLDPDRMIAGFEAVSRGQDPANGVTLYGGWEGGWSLLRGHTLGHYLTALAQAHKQTVGTDPQLNQQIGSVLDHVIGQLKTFQDRSSNGYLFASPEVHFDVVEGRVSGDMWVPWYTMHKIIAGLVDVHKLTGNPVALEVAATLGDWVYDRTSRWDAAMRSRVLGVEYGGMNDCLYELYKYTNDPNHLTAAHRFDEDTFFSPISQGNDTLNGLHANTQIPKLVGAANRYHVLGSAESFYLTAAEQFWEMVVYDHTYVTGGNSENERFRAAGQLDATRNDVNNETCNSYNMLKLTKELFKITGDIKYADYYERAFINEILSAINPETGMTTYFKPMGTGYYKHFGRETDTFWCCNGTGMENFTKLNQAIYFNDGSNLYVNMYLSSTLNWSDRSFALTQTANVPLSPTVTFTIDAAPASEVGIRFRKPDWIAAGQLVTLRVNGAVSCIQSTGGYFEVSRVWSAGDRVELELPADVRVSRLPDNQNAVAFSYGPVVLSAGLGTQQMVSTGHMATEKATIPAGVTIKDTIAINSGTIEDWIANIGQNLVQTPGTLEFTLRNTDEDGNLRFTPQYLRYADRYGIYFRLQGEQGTNQGTGGTGGEASTDCDAGAGGAGTGGVGTGGVGATGGVAGTGGVTTTGGAGGVMITGGAGGTGGMAITGGIGATAGSGATPNSGATGGATPGGGAGGTGATATGGDMAFGGGVASGGTPLHTGGAISASGGLGGSVSLGGGPSTGGSGSGAVGAAADDDGGCGCRAAGRRAHPLPPVMAAALGFVMLAARRRRRARPARD